MNKLLSGINIVDFSHRLPGPFGSYLLANMGANVSKVEDDFFKDPFISGAFPKIDESFSHWYRQFNKDKNVLRLDFKSSSIKDEIKKLIEDADAVILALPEKVITKLGIRETLDSSPKNTACIEMVASLDKSKSHMHDLNAMAETGLLSLHIEGRDESFIAPPLLPFAGIAFGASLGLELLATLLRVKNENKTIFHQVGLLDSTQNMFGPFWPKESREQKTFLHTGRYPCYGIYRTKDGHYLALAAVEDKFWSKFCELFELGELNGFDTNNDGVKKKLIETFSNLTLDQVISTTRNHEICLSVL